MDPIAIRDAMLDHLNLLPHLQARPANGEDGSGLVYGIVTRVPSGGEAWWQLAARSTPGSAADGLPDLPAPPALPTSGPVAMGDVEQHVARAVQAAGATAAERYSTRERVPLVGYGVHGEFPDGTGVYVQLHWTLNPGEERRESNRHQVRHSI